MFYYKQVGNFIIKGAWELFSRPMCNYIGHFWLVY